MRAAILSSACLAVLLAVSAQARPARHAPHPGGAKSIGKFDDWQAATHEEGEQLVCYAFSRAASSSPALPGRGDVVLTVTQRPGSRDVVAISAGFAYAPNAEVTLEAGNAKLPFYTAQRSAFARDGHAAVAALAHLAADPQAHAVAHSPAPRHMQLADSFSLHGFDPAYAAINKACPK